MNTTRTKSAHRHSLYIAVLFAFLGLGLGGTSKAQAQQKLKVAPLGPSGTTWWRAFQAWSGTLKKETKGQLSLQLVRSDIGKEEQVVKKLKAGKIDGATLTAIGIGQLVPELLVLQAPDLAKDYTTMATLRSRLGEELEASCEKKGYVLVGLGNVGRARIFSHQPISKPSDLRGSIAVHPSDRLTSAWSKTVDGLQVKRIPLSKVSGALRSKKVIAAPGSAIAAFYLGWYKEAKYMTEPPGTVLLSATLMRKDRFDALSQEQKKALLSSSERAHKWLEKKTQKEDTEAFRKIASSGIKSTSLKGAKSSWAQKAKATRSALATKEKLFTKALLSKAEAAVSK